MAIIINMMYHLTLNPGLAAGYSLRLWTFLSWRLEWLQNTYLLPCHSGKPALSFLLSDLKVIKKRPETKNSVELHPIWLFHVLSLWWNACNMHHHFLVSSSINLDNESRPDHLIMVMFWVPAAVGCTLSHKLKCTVDLLYEGTNILMLLAMYTTESVTLRFHERRSKLLPTKTCSMNTANNKNYFIKAS